MIYQYVIVVASSQIVANKGVPFASVGFKQNSRTATKTVISESLALWLILARIEKQTKYNRYI